MAALRFGLGGIGSRAYIDGEEGATRDISCGPGTSLMVSGCSGCTFTLRQPCAKLVLDRCRGCTFVVEAPVRTQVCECIRLDACTLRLRTPFPTLTVDLSTDVTVEVPAPEMLEWVYLSRCADVRIAPRGDAADARRLPVGPADFPPDAPWRWEKLQYRARWDPAADSFATEPVVRAASGYVLNESEGMGAAIQSALDANERRQQQQQQQP